MTFERLSGTVTRFIMVDLTSGQKADLFNALEAAPIHPDGMSITPDGTRVITGRADTESTTASAAAQTTVIDVRGFPNGPFPKTTIRDPCVW